MSGLKMFINCEIHICSWWSFWKQTKMSERYIRCKNSSCLLLRPWFFVPTSPTGAFVITRPAGPETPSNTVWMSKMCRMCLLATTAGIYYDPLRLRSPLTHRVSYIYMSSVCFRSDAFPSPPLSHAQVALKASLKPLGVGKSQPVVNLQEWTTLRVQGSTWNVWERQDLDLRANYVVVMISSSI